MAEIYLSGVTGTKSVIGSHKNIKILEYKKNLRLRGAGYDVENYGLCRQQAVIAIGDESPMVVRKSSVLWTVGELEEQPAVHRMIDFATNKLSPVCRLNSSSWHGIVGCGRVMLEDGNRFLCAEPLDAWGDYMIDSDIILAYDGNASVCSRVYRDASDMDGYGRHFMRIKGNGSIVLSLPCEKSDLVHVVLDNEALEVRTDLVIAWNCSLMFNVKRKFVDVSERTGKSTRFVNCFRGSGDVLMLRMLE